MGGGRAKHSTYVMEKNILTTITLTLGSIRGRAPVTDRRP